MRSAIRLGLCFFGLVCSAMAQWRVAEPGWVYQFPRDHGAHPDFKTEWWYFTGNLQDPSGRRFGYQLTLFRQGVRPPSARGSETSRFIVNDFKFGHFALSDVAAQRFIFEQKLSRGAFGEAGFGADGRLAWLEDWSIEMGPEEHLKLNATGNDGSLRLELSRLKPWTIHGRAGVSEKAAGAGHASHYYSGTRLKTEGELTLDGKKWALQGESWFDHEWATNQLTAEQVGWNWFSLQLQDGSELMLYQMRLRDGRVDPSSNGTIIAPDGTSTYLSADAFALKAVEFWTSAKTKARYPVGWDLQIPALDLRLKVSTPLKNQELVFGPLSYWEGVIDSAGQRAGKPLQGRGYMELTGYSGPLVGLSN